MDYKKKYLKYKKKYLNAKKIYGGNDNIIFTAKKRRRPENKKDNESVPPNKKYKEMEEKKNKEMEEEKYEEFVEKPMPVLTIFYDDLTSKEQELSEGELVIQQAEKNEKILKLGDTIDFDYNNQEGNKTKKVVHLEPLVLFTIRDIYNEKGSDYKQHTEGHAKDNEGDNLLEKAKNLKIGDYIVSSGPAQGTADYYIVIQNKEGGKGLHKIL